VTELPLEVELKFEADDEGPLDALAVADRLGPAWLGPPSTIEETDRYLDTPDLRLSALRWACRLRTRQGRTVVSLKGPGEHQPGDLFHRRPELEGPAVGALDPGQWPASAARRLLDTMRDGQPLEERFILTQQRTERTVQLARRHCGLLSLDRTQIWQGGEQIGALLTVELEVEPSAIERGVDPSPLARSLSLHPGLRPDPATKLEHALRLLGAER
jgi:inorganic triphosphatase YgiF